MSKFFAVLILVFLSVVPVFANSVPASEIVKNLPDFQSVNCKYFQVRTFGSTKIKSGGDFKFVKGKGVWFMTTYPVSASSSYTSSNNKYINNIILALTKKNFSALDKDFEFFMSKHQNVWTLKLVPKNPSIKNHIDSIVVHGNSEYITAIEFSQVNPASYTDIKFDFGG